MIKLNRMLYSYRRVFLFFKQFLSPYSGKFFLATVLTSVSSAVWLYNAYAVAQIVDFIIAYTPGHSLEPLYLIFTI